MSNIFITGATSGIGRATAMLFASNGWNVVATGRRAERLDELRAHFPDRILTLPLDVRDADAVLRITEALPDDYAGIDVLLNNAGLAQGVNPVQNSDPDDWMRMIDTNIKGVLNVTRAILPGMVAANHGHVINIGSVAADNPYHGGNVYGATKAFIKQLTRNLRCDLHGTKVRVTDVAPGLLETEFTTVRLHGDQAASDRFYAGTEPLKPEDIAATIWFVATLPEHVNVNRIDIMPTCQHYGPALVYKE